MTERQSAPQRQVSPCPFCGATWGTGLTAAYGGQPATSWHIHCSPCRVSGPRVEGGSTESIGIAIDLWNRRTPPSERGTSGLAYSEAPDPKGPRLESQHGLEPAPGGKFHTNAAGKASEQSHFARGQENKPSPAAPSTAPQVAEDSAGRLGKPAEALQDRATSPAAAVDDPVALYGDLVVASPKSLGEMATHEWVIRALYAHAERKGMLAAAEICKRRGWSMTGEVILAAAMQAGSKP